MKITAAFLTTVLAVCAATAYAVEPDTAPQVYKIEAPHLTPEDCAFDRDNERWFQSNLYRGYIHVANADGSAFDITIPHVSSPQPFGTPYQLAGLSLNHPTKPTRLYGVAKDRQAFVFKSNDPTQSVSPNGANRFVAYDLPVDTNSQPAWSVRLDRVQDRLAKKLGGKARPFGPVDSVQDKDGNSYVVFALGAPAIAKIDPSGKSIEAWSIEAPKSSRLPRVGYTGISYDAESNRLIAYGGPRTLTMFDLSSKTPSTPIPVKIEGSLRVSAITAAEKINLVQSTDGTGPRLMATNAPYVYSFRSTSKSNPWSTVSYKQYTREEFKNNGLTVVCEANFKGASGKRERQIYAQGAYFSEGANSDRKEWPLYKLPGSLLTA